MRTVAFMSTKHFIGFSIDDDVAAKLLADASNSAKANNSTASKYVNSLLKWALDHYDGENDAIRNPLAKQVSND